VVAELSEHQREALAAYYELTESQPELFGGRERRPIVLDRAVIEGYAREHEVVLGVGFANQYLWVVNDLVRSRDRAGNERLHPYLRTMGPPQPVGTPMGAGSVILATVPASGSSGSDGSELIVLVEQERHQSGTLELELPRGFAAPGVSPGEQALRELAEETGYRGEEARLLGRTGGSADKLASIFHIPVTGRGEQAPETGEAITRIVLLSRDELWERIDSGALYDPFTVQALGLYEHRLAQRDAH
jgi:ADP-ribose pyrophosphatase